MKSVVKLLCAVLLVGALPLLSGCDDSDDGGDEAAVRYSTADLGGTWRGTLSIVGSSQTGNRTVALTFDSQGNVTFLAVNPQPVASGGRLAVSPDGRIVGSTFTLHNTPSGMEGIAWAWSSQMTTPRKMTVTAETDWSNERGVSGEGLIFGTLTK